MESTAYVTMILLISCLESNRLAICSPLHVSVHCCLVIAFSIKILLVLPIASILTGAHRDSQFLPSELNTQRYSRLCLGVKSFPLTSYY